MRLKRPEDLDGQLAERLAPVYLISGDEPLLVQEAADAVRAAGRAAGVDEREVFHVESGFDWRELLEAAGSLSLFASRRLLELRMKSAAPGKDGGEALVQWASAASGDDVLLILMPRLDARSQKTKWYTTLESVGVHLPVWPVGLDELPRWLGGRCRREGVSLEPDALEALCARVEGNLLAANQAVQRLALAGHEGAWSVDDLAAVLDDDARYTPFELIDKVLARDAEHVHRILDVLRAEGTEPLQLVGLLAKELRQLRALQADRSAGRPLDAAMKQRRVFPRRQGLIKGALTRMPMALLDGALRDLAVVDQAVKGLVDLDPWDELDRLLLRLAGVRTTPLGVRARGWLETV
jgi:DNA polymerase-3 subunit delta